MELINIHKNENNPGSVIVGEILPQVIENILLDERLNNFIEANTEPCSLQELTLGHIIPVFIKDNEPVISHNDFIRTAIRAVSEIFHSETILPPDIRMSHPVKEKNTGGQK